MEQPAPVHQPNAPPAGVSGPAGAPAAAGMYQPAGAAYAAPPEGTQSQQHSHPAPQNGATPGHEQQATTQGAAGPAAYGAPAGPSAPPIAAPPPAGLSGSKRPYEQSGAADGYHTAGGYSAADGGAAKRQQVAAAGSAVPRETVYRIVLDVVDTALIIGRGGNTVRQIEAATGGRVKRLQEPPGAREQVIVIWVSARELPSPGRIARNAAQEALIDCVRRVVFQENAPMGQPMSVRMLINRTQEQGVMDNMAGIVAENPGISIELRRAQELPPCALDNDVLVELKGERYSLMSAVEALSHVLREHPILERPGGAPAALRALAGPPAAAAAPPAGGYGAPPYGGSYRGY